MWQTPAGNIWCRLTMSSLPATVRHHISNKKAVCKDGFFHARDAF
jgi:hypothetical protein